MELKIISPKEDGFVKSIEFNHEELKAGLEGSLKKYEGLVYTEDTIQDAKKDRATLNRFKKALNDKCMGIKRLCLAPYNDFEAKIKELIGLVDEPMLAIDGQVKGYEERKRSEKQEAIQEFWNAAESNVKTLVTLERIFDPRWLNVTFSMVNIEEKITVFFNKVESELTVIEELKTEFEDQVVRVYLQSFSIATALSENTKLVDQKKQREEYAKAQQAKAEAAAAVAAKAQEQRTATQPVKQPTQQPVEQPAPAPIKPEVEREDDPVKQIDFRVWATTDQLTQLRNFLTTTGIQYGRVEDEQAA